MTKKYELADKAMNQPKVILPADAFVCLVPALLASWPILDLTENYKMHWQMFWRTFGGVVGLVPSIQGFLWFSYSFPMVFLVKLNKTKPDN